MKRILLLIGCSLIALQAADADIIHLKNGHGVPCTVHSFTAEGFRVKTESGKMHIIKPEAIREIVFAIPAKTPPLAPTKPNRLVSHSDIAPPKTKSLTQPEEIAKNVHAVGLTDRFAWQVSSRGNWVGHYLWRDLLGSVEVELIGPRSFLLSSVRVRIDSYHREITPLAIGVAKNTLRAALPDCPDEVAAAFLTGQAFKTDGWEVIPQHITGRHKVELIRTITN